MRFSAHPYVFAEGAKGTPASAIRHLEELKTLVDRLAPGRNIPIYVTEAGWPVHAGQHGVTEQVSADYLRQFMLRREGTSLDRGRVVVRLVR